MESPQLSSSTHNFGKGHLDILLKLSIVLSLSEVCNCVLIFHQVVFIGMGFGSPVWGNVSDKYGRKVVSVVSFFQIVSVNFFYKISRISSFEGSDNMHVLDFILWHSECLCSNLWLALGPAGLCRLRDRRSSSVVSYPSNTF